MADCPLSIPLYKREFTHCTCYGLDTTQTLDITSKQTPSSNRTLKKLKHDHRTCGNTIISPHSRHCSDISDIVCFVGTHKILLSPILGILPVVCNITDLLLSEYTRLRSQTVACRQFYNCSIFSTLRIWTEFC